MPEFYMLLAQKLSKYLHFYYIWSKIKKIPEFYTIFAGKMTEFYITILPEKYFPEFLKGTCPPCLHLHAPMIV